MRQPEGAERTSRDCSEDQCEELFKGLMNCSLVGFFLLRGGRIALANEGLCGILGRSPEEICQTDVMDLVHPEDREAVRRGVKQILSGGAAQGPLRFRVLHPHEGHRWALSHGERVELAGGPAIVGHLLDITDQVQRKEALRESEYSYRQLVENSGDTIFVFQGGHIRYVSPKGIPEYGYNAEELKRTLFVDIVHPEDRDMVLENYRRRVRGLLAPEVYPFRMVDKWGRTRWAEFRAVPFRWEGAPAVLAFLRDVTERVQATEALKEQKRFISTLIGNLSGMVYRCKDDPQRTMEFCSEGARELTGYGPEELVGDRGISYGGLIHPDDRAAVWERIQDALRGRRPFEVTYRIQARDGRWKWAREKGRGVFSDTGGLTALEGFITDVTDIKDFEEELENKNAYYQGIFQGSPDGVVLLDPEGRAQEINEAFERLFQYSAEEAMGRPIDELIGLTGKEAEVRREFQRAISGQVNRFRGLRRRKDGSSVMVDVTGYPIMVKGRIVGCYGIYRDISDQMEMQAYFEGLFHGSPLAIAMLNREGEVLMVNRAFERMFQYTLEEARGKNNLELIVPPKLREEGLINKQRALDGEVFSEESVRMRRDGTLVDVLVTGYPIYIGGEVKGIYAIYMDISEMKRAQRELQEANRRYQDLVENVPAGIYEIDMETMRFRNVNDYMCRLFGYSREEFLSLTAPELGTEEGKQVLRERRQRALRGLDVPQVVEYPGIAKDGRRIHVRVQSSFGKDPEGRPVARVIMTDVTEQRQLEEQLIQAQKMEALGRLAGGIAHDFNNMLTVIMGNAQLALMQAQAGTTMHNLLKQIEDAAKRASTFTKQILAFSRRQHMQFMPININHLIKGMEGMIRTLVGEDVQLLMRLDHKVHALKGDPSQLQQVVMNLVVNARDAMPQGGTLTFETEMVDLRPHEAQRLHGDPEPGPHVCLRIRDTGVGMTEEVRSRAFEPFFTTKEEGKGTGLGLSTVYGIVTQLKGAVSVESSPGKGTTFFVYLPVATEQDQKDQGQKAPPSQGKRGSGKVLLVEDEEGVREVIREFLARFGFEVLEASNGLEALKVLEDNDSQVKLLVTDLVMPKMDGWELAGRAKSTRPGLKVLYMTGHDRLLHGTHRNPDGAVILHKPFGPEELIEKVRKVLAG